MMRHTRTRAPIVGRKLKVLLYVCLTLIVLLLAYVGHLMVA